MGGGDLNSKKSWHPNTMKNQERVWKAEQAAAEEKKRITDLQRERLEERDRAELNELAKKTAGSTSDNRLHWMYDKPDKKGQDEDYLLGKVIDKNYDKPDKPDQDIIPAVARRVVGSSMITTSGDSQVDLARKMREDPLLLVKERERAARAALLNNPLQRRKLTELLRKEQEAKEKKKAQKTKKSIDMMLASKLNALGGEKGLDLAALLASDSSSSDSSDESEKVKKKKKKKHQKEKKTKKKKKHSKKDYSDSDDDKNTKSKKKGTIKKHKKELLESNTDTELRSKCKSNKERITSYDKKESRKRKSDDSDTEVSAKRRKHRSRSKETVRYPKNESSHRERRNSADRYERGEKFADKRDFSPERKSETERDKGKRQILDESERAARLAAMAAAGADRELQRGRRVAEQRRGGDADVWRSGPPGPSAGPSARLLPDSLEARIHSNRHYIQRGHRHMDQHFARR